MIDTDIFQVVTLVLLLLILIALLASLSTLNGIKKEIGSARGAENVAPAAGYGGAEATTGYGTYSGGYGGQQAEPQPAAAQPAAAQPAPVQQAPVQQAPVQQAPVQQAPAQQEVATGYVPMSQVPATDQPAAQTPGLTGTEPEEQPFERDGRWWFKRGNELLVYDEGTGQWVPAPGTQQAAASAAGSADAPATATYPTTTTDAGEGWRCPSCGAINGSTATVCRMCFTPRA